MSHDEPQWGEPPIGEVLARLLAERYPIPAHEILTVDVVGADEEEAAGEGGRALHLRLQARRHHYRILVRYQRGAGRDRDPWLLMVDALDALYGSFLEADRDHRTLPSGPNVAFDGAYFIVEVEHAVPELEKLADQLLGGDVTPPES